MNNTVAIVIPTHNRGMSFVRAINSVVRQTHDIQQIIVSDHNSTDNTEEITRDYMKSYPNMSYYKWPASINITMNWMLGAMPTTTTWVKYVFDDDWIEPTCVEQLLANTDDRTLVSQCGATFEPIGIPCYHSYVPRWNIPMAVRAGILSVSPVTAIHRRDALMRSFGQFSLLSQRSFDNGVGPNVLMNYGQVVQDESLHRHIPDQLVRLGGDDLPGYARSLTSRLKESDPDLLYGEHNAAYDLLDRLASG